MNVLCVNKQEFSASSWRSNQGQDLLQFKIHARKPHCQHQRT